MHAIFMLGVALGASGAAVAARSITEGITFSIEVRTAEQLNAFYSARGLPAAAVAEIIKTCFFTVGIRNTRTDTAWLDLSKWQLRDAKGRALTRIARRQWETQLRTLDVPAAARSTFGWTQLPETRDLQPDEPVGGNIAFLPAAGPLTLEAVFPLGAASSARAVTLRVANLRCAQALP